MSTEQRAYVELAFMLTKANGHVTDDESAPAGIDDSVFSKTNKESEPACIDDSLFGETDQESTQAFPAKIPNIFDHNFSRWLDIPHNTGKSTLLRMFDDYRANQHDKNEVDIPTPVMSALLRSQSFTPDECQRISQINRAIWSSRMECSSTKLKIVAQNQFGDYGFAVDPDGVIDATDLDPISVWTIRDPDDSLSFLGGERRTYDETKYLLSPKAAKVLPVNKSSNGAMTAISVEIGNKDYFVLTGDNKKYLMNCGGALEPGESFRAAAVREIFEELGIHVKKSKLQTVAKWTYTYGNSLIGPATWTSMNIGFYVNLPQDSVQHLVPAEHVWSEINVFRPQHLSETELVVFILKDALKEAPSLIQGKLFNAHHRRMLHLLADEALTSDCDTSNLSSFTWRLCKHLKGNATKKD
jgi:8-oxo-dGTP pyrophosphatase MutT (NUDIX family)